MIIVHVNIFVRAENINDFIEATIINANQSLKETGVVKFDFLQDSENLERFLLIEIYRSTDDISAHKLTTHYLTWRDTVAPMMASPRIGVKYKQIFTENLK